MAGGWSMRSEELMRAGDLEGALGALQDEIRANPADVRLRIFLFQLLSVMGDWSRALTQLNVAAEMDPESRLMAEMCRPALSCEALRTEVFAGARTPLVMGEPRDWLAGLIQALALLGQGHAEAAAELRDKAFAEAPARPGTVDGKPFQWIADADTRLGPVLEAVVEGRYYWIPFEHIASMLIEPPKDLRDVVWLPAHFVWMNGGKALGLIPSRYAGSERAADPAIRLARKTEWKDLGSGFACGSGQRMLATDEGDLPLFDVRAISFESEGAAPPAPDETPAGAG